MIRRLQERRDYSGAKQCPKQKIAIAQNFRLILKKIVHLISSNLYALNQLRCNGMLYMRAVHA